MHVDLAIRAARSRAGLTQSALAELTGTSQATVSAYESGRKIPSVDTLERLLSATGHRLAVVRSPSGERGIPFRDHGERGRALLEVIALAEALPTRHDSVLRYPRLSLSTP